MSKVKKVSLPEFFAGEHPQANQLLTYLYGSPEAPRRRSRLETHLQATSQVFVVDELFYIEDRIGKSMEKFGALRAQGTMKFAASVLPNNPSATVLVPCVIEGTAALTDEQADKVRDKLSVGKVRIETNGTGSVKWLYEMSVYHRKDLGLGAGETVVLTHTVEVSGQGGSATQDVAITITGTKDGPVISPGMQNSGLIEVYFWWKVAKLRSDFANCVLGRTLRETNQLDPVLCDESEDLDGENLPSSLHVDVTGEPLENKEANTVTVRTLLRVILCADCVSNAEKILEESISCNRNEMLVAFKVARGFDDHEHEDIKPLSRKMIERTYSVIFAGLSVNDRARLEKVSASSISRSVRDTVERISKAARIAGVH